MRRSAAVMLAMLLVAGCTPAQRDDPQVAPTPTADAPAAGPPAVEADVVDPCLLTDEEVADVIGIHLPEAGASGGEVFALCTYGGEDVEVDVPGTVDIALVDLQRVAEESGEAVSGDEYVAELTRGVGTGTATPLSGYGDGDAVLLAYPFGSQAWAWVEAHVYGAYVSDLEDADALAEEVLRAVLDAVGSQ